MTFREPDDLHLRAPAAASAWRSPAGWRATAPTSSSPPRPPSRTRSCRARSSAPPRRSTPPAARRCRSSATSATRQQVQAAVDQGVAAFGGIDVCINNASAISLTGTLATDMKRYDLMNQVNARGTFLCSKLTLPHLLKAANPHILNLAPPLDLDPKWFAHHVAYTMAKFGMSLCTLGMAAEFTRQGRASTRSGRSRRSTPPPSASPSAATRWRPSAAAPRSWPTPPTRSCRGRSPNAAATSSSTRRCCAPKA